MITELICAASLLIVVVSTAHSQRVPRTFTQISGGAILEQSLYNVRSELGATGAVAIGRVLSDALAMEGHLAVSGFPGPQQIISPGGCLGSQPCVYPSVSEVAAVTLGASGEYVFAPEPGQTARPLVLLGAGARYVSEHPYRSADTRPYAEAGVGVTLAHWGFRARYQVSSAGRDLPTWMVPMTLDYRF